MDDVKLKEMIENKENRTKFTCESLEKIENTILGHSVDEILFSNLKHFYGYENSGEVSYEKLSSKFAK